MRNAAPVNDLTKQSRRFRFGLRGLFLSMLLVASACYVLRDAYYWHVKSVKAVLSEYPELEVIRISGINGQWFFEVKQAHFSIAGKPKSTMTISIPYSAPKSRIRRIVDGALANPQKF